MNKPTVPNQRLRLSARRLVKTVATSALPLSAMACLLMASVPNAVQAAAPPFGPSRDGFDKNIFFFTPSGNQLDLEMGSFVHVPDAVLPDNKNTNIYDIRIGPNMPLPFNLYLYATAPQYDDGDLNTITTIEIDPFFDITEWLFKGFTPNLNVLRSANPCTSQPGNDGPGDPNLICHFKPNFKVTKGDFGDPKLIGTFNGITLLPGFEPHDNIEDFKLTLQTLRYGNKDQDVVGVTQQFQDVEVQKVPAPLPFFGAAAAIGTIRKLRKFSSQLKTFSLG